MRTNRHPNSTERRTQWFSDFFGINLPQYEIPFVDFNLFSDVPLYVDPYAITKTPTELAKKCHETIVSYFQTLLDSIREGNRTATNRLIRGKLSEPTEIHLGVGTKPRAGRGIGEDQEARLIAALANSHAAKTGAIQTIQELELHIPGVGPDKVSDLVANIILGLLAEFTEEVCNEYGVSTRPCAVSGFWNPVSLEWDGGYFNLPVHQSHDYILVPKQFIRRDKDLMNHRDFYNKYVLEVLQRELLNANDSLVRTLQNGSRRITKKSLKEDPRFALSKEFVSKFILDRPDVVDQYREELLNRFRPADPALWSGKADEDDPGISIALERLKGLRPGKEDADSYHDTVQELLQFVFDYSLVNFEKEYEMDQGRGRIDIIADNKAGEGLFCEMRNAQFFARSIPIECKNYAADLGNNEFNQLADRLGEKTSRFGMVFCRTIDNYTRALQHQSDRWLRQNLMILLIDDSGLERLVAARLNRDYQAIESYLRLQIREVQYNGASKLTS